MNEKMFEIMKNKPGFIAALDQSGGSSSKTLKNYGIEESEYSSEEEMFNLIHEMRKRVFTSKAFTNDHIIGAILFEKTMLSKVNGQFTADYLWNEKQIVSFLKVDKGLAEQANGVKLMKEIPELDEELKEANEKNIFGTKMRSVIYEPNEEGIKAIVKQQFELAERICNAGLVPIIEPEVDINAPEKEKCEEILKNEIKKQLDSWDESKKIMFKFTIPTRANHYLDLYDYSCVVRIVALSGGYDIEEAVELLAKNNKMIASFSRALLQDLNVHQTQEEFDQKLNDVIIKILFSIISNWIRFWRTKVCIGMMIRKSWIPLC